MSRRRRKRSGPRASAWWLLVGATALGGVLVAGGHLVERLPDQELPRTLEYEAPDPPAVWDRTRVEVLNAGGVRGMAARVRDELRAHGFDVVYYGNAERFDREHTVVLARTGSLEAARAVAARLGVERVEAEPDSTRLVDVSVMLGADGLRQPSGPEEGPARPPDGDDGRHAARRTAGAENAPTRPWWDPRRFITGLIRGATPEPDERPH